MSSAVVSEIINSERGKVFCATLIIWVHLPFSMYRV
ncbi:Uncharacterised protein [Vibrio cholerae]|nr:Uncharacterised protein [Vibrio cholerae]